MRVLVVDDSRIMRNIVKNTVTKMIHGDHEFLEASDGEDAFNILNEQQIDLLLLDWNMPKLNGLQLVKMLREMKKFKDLPIIMVTSEAAKYNVIDAITAGVNDYATKPVSEQSLSKKINRLINKPE